MILWRFKCTRRFAVSCYNLKELHTRLSNLKHWSHDLNTYIILNVMQRYAFFFFFIHQCIHTYIRVLSLHIHIYTCVYIHTIWIFNWHRGDENKSSLYDQQKNLYSLTNSIFILFRYIYTCLYIYVYVYTYIYICIHIYVYINDGGNQVDLALINSSQSQRHVEFIIATRSLVRSSRLAFLFFHSTESHERANK